MASPQRSAAAWWQWGEQDLSLEHLRWGVVCSQNNVQREIEKLEVTKKSWCEKAVHQTPQLELLPHRNPTPPWEEGILPQWLYAFQIQAGWRVCRKFLWPRQWQNPVVSLWTSCWRVGCLHKHMWILTEQTGVRTHECARARVCVLYLFTQHTSTSAPKWNSPLQDLCQSQHIFITCQGSGSGKRAVSPLLSFLLSPLSILSFRSCDKQKGAIHSIMITHMTLSDLHSFHV